MNISHFLLIPLDNGIDVSMIHRPIFDIESYQYKTISIAIQVAIQAKHATKTDERHNSGRLELFFCGSNGGRGGVVTTTGNRNCRAGCGVVGAGGARGAGGKSWGKLN